MGIMKKAKIFYFKLQNEQTKEEKLKWFERTKFEDIPFEHIAPDIKSNWINLTDQDTAQDYESFIFLLDKKLKKKNASQSIFELFSRGIETGRDEWVYDLSSKNLSQKIRFFIDIYNHSIEVKNYDFRIKWNSSLKIHAENKKHLTYRDHLIVRATWRPFTYKYLYVEKPLNHRLTQNHYEMYGFSPILKGENYVICCTDAGTQSPFMVIATQYIPDLHLVGTAAQCLPLYRYDENGTRIDNITDWGLTQFQTHYQSPRPADTPLDKGGRGDQISKLDIFHYTYAVLHHPAYRSKYELNLKREFPRLPFYPNFHQWVNWGKALMNLHLNYETIEPYGLTRSELKSIATPKAKLKADKTKGVIILDDNTQLTDVPAIAWDYKLGNRSALEWILDQYKEKKPRDPTIGEKFNTYKFADYKEQVIDLLQRVCTVSVKTMEIIQQMPDTVEHQG